MRKTLLLPVLCAVALCSCNHPVEPSEEELTIDSLKNRKVQTERTIFYRTSSDGEQYKSTEDVFCYEYDSQKRLSHSVDTTYFYSLATSKDNSLFCHSIIAADKSYVYDGLTRITISEAHRFTYNGEGEVQYADTTTSESVDKFFDDTYTKYVYDGITYDDLGREVYQLDTMTVYRGGEYWLRKMEAFYEYDGCVQNCKAYFYKNDVKYLEEIIRCEYMEEKCEHILNVSYSYNQIMPEEGDVSTTYKSSFQVYKYDKYLRETQRDSYTEFTDGQTSENHYKFVYSDLSCHVTIMQVKNGGPNGFSETYITYVDL